MVSWAEISNANCTTEGDVELRILLPLLEMIGYSKSEIYSKVPVIFREGKRGRKHEADLVVSVSDPKVSQKGLITVEAKSPDEDLFDGGLQADSYAHALNSPFYVVANDKEFQIWQKKALEKSSLILDIKITDLVGNQEVIRNLLSKSAIISYLKEVQLPDINIKVIDSDQYTAHLREELEVDFFHPRKLLQKDKDRLVNYHNVVKLLQDSSGVILEGSGGRGKTTLIKTILGEMWIGERDNLPVYISVTKKTSSLFTEIIQKISLFSNQIINEASLKGWIKSSGLIIGIDNWEEIEASKRGDLSNELKIIARLGAKVIVGKRPNVVAPSGYYTLLEVSQYGEEDVDKIIHNYLITKGISHRFPGQILKNVPGGMRALLREPVILGKFLDLLLLNGVKVSEPPCSLIDLMDELIGCAVRSRSFELKEKVTEVYAVCCKLSLVSGSQFDLECMSKTLSELSIQKNASSVLVDYCNIGLFIHLHGDNYTFNHDIWRIYFKYLSLFNKWKEKSIEDGMKLIESIEVDDFKLVWPFLVSSIDQPDKQDKLFHELMDSPELYLSALKWRSPANFSQMNVDDAERWCVSQFRSGYFDPILSWCPLFKEHFFPWCNLPQELRAAGKNSFKYIGRVSETGAQFVKVYTDIKSPDVILSKDVSKYFDDKSDIVKMGSHFMSLSLSGYGRDSGRRYSLEDFFKHISEKLNKGDLPYSKWIAIEKFIKVCNSIKRNISSVDYEDITPSFLKQWAEDEVSKVPAINGIRPVIGYGMSGIDTDEIDILCTALEKLRLGHVRLAEMGLPGPDLDKHGYFCELYSGDQKQLRVKHLYEAVFETYIDVCEKIFPKLKHLFFYRYFPLNIVVSFEDNKSGNPMCASAYEYYYEPAENLSGCRIEQYKASKSLHVDYERMTEPFKEKGITDFSGLSLGSTLGEWNPGEAVVTKLVCKMLEDDFEKLARDL